MHKLAVLMLLFLPTSVVASVIAPEQIDLTRHAVGYAALAVFVAAYLLVIFEEFTVLRKSKPVIIAAGLIWAMVALFYASGGSSHLPEESARHNLLEYAELALFLLVAMTYVNAMEERRVFDAMRAWMVRRGLSLRQIFWLTGLLSFIISPIADNLTTALLMCAVVLAVGGDNRRFISLGCINIVVAANAGGAFSPFGDITTLMVWQKGMVDFWTFFLLFLPSVVNWLVPAGIMHFAVPDAHPEVGDEVVIMKRGAVGIMVLFLCTIATAVTFHNVLHLPPVMGMFTGLGYLQFYGYYLKITYDREYIAHKYDLPEEQVRRNEKLGVMAPFDIFNKVARVEWDTLLFFYGVVMCVGGLGFIGYLALLSEVMYVQLGAMVANVSVGVLSAIVDNIPVMFAVLAMQPDMSLGHWLLVTLTAGVGGSLLSIGSAAGVALMGQARGHYTFMGHLKWMPVIALGYVASIATHLWVNSNLF